MEIEKFKSWLISQGAEILQPTNEFEILRFRSRKGTGVVYISKRGFSVSGQLVTDAYACMKEAKPWDGKGKPTKRTQGSFRRRQLLDRDGDNCFYCGRELGADMTVEHLVSVNQGGPDRLENLVPAHQRCNQEAGNMAVMEKIKLRERLLAFSEKAKFFQQTESQEPFIARLSLGEGET